MKFTKAKDVEVGMILKNEDGSCYKVVRKAYKIGIYFIDIQPLMYKKPYFSPFGIMTLTMGEDSFNNCRFEVIGTAYEERL